MSKFYYKIILHIKEHNILSSAVPNCRLDKHPRVWTLFLELDMSGKGRNEQHVIVGRAYEVWSVSSCSGSNSTFVQSSCSTVRRSEADMYLDKPLIFRFIPLGGEIHFLTLSRRAAALCNRPRWLYDQKYALIALRVYFGPGSSAKNNTSQNKARVMWTRSNLRCLWRGFCLALKCPVPKLQCCHNEVLPCNYPAVLYTQQLRAEKVQSDVCVLCFFICASVCVFGLCVLTRVGGPDQSCPCLMNYGAPAVSSILQRRHKHAAYWHQPAR